MKKEIFGELNKDDKVHKFTLLNKEISLSVIEYGAAIQSLKFRGKEMVLGYDNLKSYVEGKDYFGAIIGRYANRIDNGCFTLNGKKYILYQNFGNSSLHGGNSGFNRKKWQSFDEGNRITFSYISRDGEEGYPGTLNAKVIYSLLEDGITIEYQAISDKDTPINLTNHTYFNLTSGEGSIENHMLTLASDYFTPINNEFIPTGEIRRVADTPFDFRTEKRIGERINGTDEQLRYADGYDHNFVINGNGFRKFAEVYSETSGITMTCYTDMPGVQFYSGNLLTNRNGRKGQIIKRRYGLCLETQFFPNSINEPKFPSFVLKAGEEFQSKTEYRFNFRYS